MLSLAKLRNVNAFCMTYLPEYVWIESINGKPFIFSRGITKVADVFELPYLVPLMSKIALSWHRANYSTNAFELLSSLIEALGPIFIDPMLLTIENLRNYPEDGLDIDILQYLYKKAFAYDFATKWEGSSPQICVAVYEHKALIEKVKLVRRHGGYLIEVEIPEEAQPLLLACSREEIFKVPEEYLAKPMVVGEALELYVSFCKEVVKFLSAEDDRSKTTAFNTMLIHLNKFAGFIMNIDKELIYHIENVSSAFVFRLLHQLATRGIAPRVCKYCGEVFIPNRSDRLYCSSRCRRLAFQKRKESQEDT